MPNNQQSAQQKSYTVVSQFTDANNRTWNVGEPFTGDAAAVQRAGNNIQAQPAQGQAGQSQSGQSGQTNR
jgi:hypothetical protein